MRRNILNFSFIDLIHVFIDHNVQIRNGLLNIVLSNHDSTEERVITDY
jgi:hypothetical protein